MNEISIYHEAGLLKESPDRLIYDGSFNGFFTAVFEIFELKAFTAEIVKQVKPLPLFSNHRIVITNDSKAQRVLAGLGKKITANSINDIFAVWLSELEIVERVLLGYVLHAFNNVSCIENDYSNFFVLDFKKIVKMVSRERHRMKAFVRFSRLKDDLYYARVDPDFNVLPLIQQHFTARYSDQQWLIYDLRRNYGIYYDLHITRIIELEVIPKNESDLVHDQEQEFRLLWQNYFTNVNIESRKNTKLHVRHVPKRYWKYLTEKGLF